MRSYNGAGYRPHLFLASLGSGGIGASFYMYFMFLVPHPDTPMATFNHLLPYILKYDFISLLIFLNILAIGFFIATHFLLLFWNIKEYILFKKSPAFLELKNSPAEVSLMAFPLTLAISINMFFIAGAIFVPNLWSVVEYLFPLALVGFGLAGALALKIFGEYFSRIMTNGEVMAPNFSKLIAAFTFGMISVGFAAPAAMSHSLTINAIGLIFSTLFAMISISLTLLILITGVIAILKDGISAPESITIWVAIPILTVVGIALVRMSNGFAHNFEMIEPKPFVAFIIVSIIFSLQIAFGYFGYLIIKKSGYFERFVWGKEELLSAFSSVCPAVAFFVSGMFFIHYGLVKTGVIQSYSVVHIALVGALSLVQIYSIKIFSRLFTKLIK